ncbi:type VI secretion protein VasK, partial [Pseudomonas veronii]
MKVWSNSWRRAGAAVWVIMLVAALGWVIWRFGDQIGLAENHHKLLVFLLIIAIAMGGVLAPRWLAHLKRQNHREQGRVGKVYPPADSQIVLPHSPTTHLLEVREHLREHYGLFWRHKTRLLLIIGE